MGQLHSFNFENQTHFNKLINRFIIRPHWLPLH